MVPAFAATGLASTADCHPEPDSPVKVTVPSLAPAPVQIVPVCTPVFSELL